MAAPAIGVRPRWGAVPGASVDWSHPMSAGLVFCAVPGVGGRCLVTGMAASNSIAARSSAWGPAGNNGASVATWRMPAAYSSFNAERFSIGVAWQKTSGTTAGALFGITNGLDWCVIGQGGSNPTISGNSITGLDEGVAWRSIASSVADGAHALVTVHNVGCWFDGAQTQTSYAITSRANWETVYLGSRNLVAGVPNLPTGDGIAVAAWWNRRLSPAEATAWTVDPFQMLRR